MVFCEVDAEANSTLVDDGFVSCINMYYSGLVVRSMDEDEANSTFIDDGVISHVDVYCSE